MAARRQLVVGAGLHFTLLVTSPAASEAHGSVAAAAAQRIPLKVLHVPAAELREFYEADVALIRPDQHVAWRGSDRASDLSAPLRRAVGF